MVNGSGIVVNQNINAASATINELTAGDLLVNGSGIVVNQKINAASASISELTAGGLLVNGGEIVVNNLSVGGTVSASDFLLSSSAEIKDNIIDLSNPEALEVLEHLSQVKFNYKADEAKKAQIGFIAEDVPRSVASSDGQGISLTNIVSVLARVVKEQQKTINALSEKFHSLELAMNRALS